MLQKKVKNIIKMKKRQVTNTLHSGTNNSTGAARTNFTKNAGIAAENRKIVLIFPKMKVSSIWAWGTLHVVI